MQSLSCRWVARKIVAALIAAICLHAVLVAYPIDGNAAKRVSDDTGTTRINEAININVLANDPAGATLLDVTQPEHGSASRQADGTLRYLPNANFLGKDSFTYRASDPAGEAASAEVRVQVTGKVTAVEARNDTATTDEGAPVHIAVLANDAQGPHALPVSVSIETPPAHGRVDIAPDQTVNYTPDLAWSGEDRFTYLAADSVTSDRADVSVSIIDVPGLPDQPAPDQLAEAGDSAGSDQADEPPAPVQLLAVDDEYWVAEDSPGNTLDVTSNDEFPGEVAPYIAIDTTPESGTVILDALQQITYVPVPSFSGTDSFTYSLVDGSNRSSATVFIEVQGANDSPTAQPDTATLAEDVAGAIDVLANDTDADGDELSVESIGTPVHGRAKVDKSGKIRYTPATDYAGVDTFTYLATDGHGATAESTVTITITAVNDPPGVGDDRLEVEIGVSGAVAVLDNDIDPDGPYSRVSIVVAPANGAAWVTTTNTITYAPNPGFEGYDSIEYQVSDGTAVATAEVQIVVGHPNSKPRARDDEIETSPDEPVVIDVKANDKDRDGDPLTVYAISEPSHGIAVGDGDSVVYTPDADFTGTDSFTYMVSDENGGRDLAKVQVTVSSPKDRRSGD
jgi:hypothetical protein